MFKKLNTFQIDLQGKIRKAEEKTEVELDPFWVERIHNGAELAVVQTPVIPSDEDLKRELETAVREREVLSELAGEVAGLREKEFSWSPDEQHPIDAYLAAIFPLREQMCLAHRAELIQRALQRTPIIRRMVGRTIERFVWEGKRYAIHPQTISEHLHIAEVDMGIPMLQIDLQGKVTQQMDPARPDRPARGPLVTRTLLGRLFPGIRVAQVTVPVHATEEQRSVVRNALYSFVYRGIRYKPTLATGGLKNGQIILVEEKYAKAVARMYHLIPQAALGYGGIIVNECSKALATFEATVKVVREGEFGTNDSRGWMDQSSFDLLQTLDPGHFYQFRMAFLASQDTLVRELSKYDESSLKLLNNVPVAAKGVFKVMDNRTASHPEIRANFIIPDSCLKPSRKDLIGKTFRCVVHLGITEQSYDGTTFGGPTVATHVPWEILSTEVYEDSARMMDELAPGFHSEGHGELLQKIGGICKSDTELMRVTEAVLAADGQGGMMYHPYVHQATKKLLAKWLRKLLSGGIELHTRALADDGFCYADSNGVLHCGSDWMPMRAALTDYEGDRSICIRFPVRMREDLLPVRHIHRTVAGRLLRMKFPHMPTQAIEEIIHRQLYLKHVHVLNGKYAKVFGGDFDFDLVYILSGVRYQKLVDWRFDYIKHEVSQPTKNKKKRESLWHQLGEICFDAMSNKVGRITNDIMSAIAVGRMDLVYVLAIELQEEVSGLKHDTSANMEVVENCERQIGNPARWIELLSKEDIRSFDDLPQQIEPLSDSDVIARYYNKLYAKALELVGEPKPLSEYSGLFHGQYGVRSISKQDYREASLLNSFYVSQSHKAIAHSAKRREELQKAKAAQKALRARIRAAEANASTEEAKEAVAALKQQSRDLNDLVRQRTAEYEKAQLDTKKGLSFFRSIVCAWGRGKAEEERMYWAAVLNEVITRKSKKYESQDGKVRYRPGTGAALIHAFPQQFVDAIAAATEGRSVLVETWNQDWSVRLDADAMTLTKVETAEDGQKRETLLYRGVAGQQPIGNGKYIPTTEWKRCVTPEFLEAILDQEDGLVETIAN